MRYVVIRRRLVDIDHIEVIRETDALPPRSKTLTVPMNKRDAYAWAERLR